MRVSTVRIENKSNGKIRKVDAVEYALDVMGMKKYRNWRVVSEAHAGDPSEKLNVTTEKPVDPEADTVENPVVPQPTPTPDASASARPSSGPGSRGGRGSGRTRP